MVVAASGDCTKVSGILAMSFSPISREITHSPTEQIVTEGLLCFVLGTGDPSEDKTNLWVFLIELNF